MYPYIKLNDLQIPTYGLCICAAVFLCAVLVLRRARKIGIDSNDLIIIFAVVIGFAMFAGNALYVFVTFDSETILGQIRAGNFRFFQNSGIVFYGALIGGVLAAVVTCKILKVKIEELEMCVVPYIPLGHSIGRIGCLLAGCCYGFSYDGIFSVTSRLNIELGPYFPVQAVEATLNLLIMGALLIYTKKNRAKYCVTSLYLILYSVLRFVLEFFRGDAIRGVFWQLSTSQWISIGLFVISGAMLCVKCCRQVKNEACKRE